MGVTLGPGGWALSRPAGRTAIFHLDGADAPGRYVLPPYSVLVAEADDMGWRLENFKVDLREYGDPEIETLTTGGR